MLRPATRIAGTCLALLPAVAWAQGVPPGSGSGGLTLEQAIAYIGDDELVEVTPKAIRLRKEVLNPSFRKKRVKED